MQRVAKPLGEDSVVREAVIRALENCYDPCCSDRRISVVDMGLIESIEILETTVRIEMVLTSGWCPFAARLLDMIQDEVGAACRGSTRWTSRSSGTRRGRRRG